MSIFIAEPQTRCHAEQTSRALRGESVEAPLYPAIVTKVGVLRLRNCFASRSSDSAQDDSFLLLIFCCSFSSAVSGAFSSSMPSGNIMRIFLCSRSVLFKYASA